MKDNNLLITNKNGFTVDVQYNSIDDSYNFYLWITGRLNRDTIKLNVEQMKAIADFYNNTQIPKQLEFSFTEECPKDPNQLLLNL